MGRMPTDFRDGKTFPRRGRERLGDALWLARLADKARAARDGTLHDYVYPCPMDRGVLERWGVGVEEFERALAQDASDDGLRAWLASRVPAKNVQAANDWLLREKTSNLDRQDAEEGA